VLRVPWHAAIRHDDRGNGPQPADDLPRLVEPPQMRIARGEKAIRYREARIISDRAEQLRQCRIETPIEEMRCAQYQKSRVHFGERAEPQRCIDMLNGEIRLVRPQPEEGADTPPAWPPQRLRFGRGERCARKRACRPIWGVRRRYCGPAALFSTKPLRMLGES
jgi:hypothetical protein